MISSFKKKKRDGFTLVELLVVIAILAVLASVSVIGYLGFTKKANLSNDQSAITQMNIGLQADAADRDNKYNYAGEAVQALYSQGWNKGKMEPYSNDYKYAYSLENNKMYLLDESYNVVFPDSNVDKSTLWGFYFDSVNKITGINHYIAMDNITNKPNFDTQVGSDVYTFDLNGYFIGIEGTYNKVNVINGVLVKGTYKEDASDTSVKKMEKVNVDTSNGTMDNVVSNDSTYDGKVYDLNEKKCTLTSNNVVFKNCYFYDSTINTTKSVTFEDCYFIDGGTKSASININNNVEGTYNVKFKGCTFTNTSRAINYVAGTGAWDKNINVALDVENCTFNGVSDPKFAALQIASTKGTINFKNNTINSLGNANCIVRYHETFFKDKINGTINDLNKFTFESNIVSSKISENNYVDLDDGRKSIEGDKNSSTFYETALNKFKVSVTKI